MLFSEYSSFVPDQSIHVLDELQLESGAVLRQAPVAYKTWGTLNAARDNAMVICHALSGSCDVADWCVVLPIPVSHIPCCALRPGRAFDTDVFFIFCGNVLGSPYGSCSPVTLKPGSTSERYGPEFPVATSRDDVKLSRGVPLGAHKRVLDALGVRQVQFVIGGSMGGMQVLEWAFFGPEYVKCIAPIATSGRQSAWCISWGESQRQAIYSDPNYSNGYYTDDNPPNLGLAAARMQALLTYRSRNSFETRFGRTRMPTAPPAGPKVPPKPQPQNSPPEPESDPSPPSPSSPAAAAAEHNEGNRSPADASSPAPNGTSEGPAKTAAAAAVSPPRDPDRTTAPRPAGPVFSAQSYLRYQGDKFVRRFDANCYIALTRKMDWHDVSRGRGDYEDVLRSIQQPTLVVGVETDGLFTISEQYELSELIPGAEIIVVHSYEGHDGFLLEFDQMNKHLAAFIRRQAPLLASEGYGSAPVAAPALASATGEAEGHDALMW
ncbi:homoserine O- acetyltransferase [Cladochytrium tenue]|nr:homoserine O- acetyltransferase [Cladochytrium tenue]